MTWDPTFYDPTITANLGLTDNVLPYYTASRQPGAPLFEKRSRRRSPITLRPTSRPAGSRASPESSRRSASPSTRQPCR